MHPVSSYIYTNTPLSNAAAAAYHADGFEVGVHVNTELRRLHAGLARRTTTRPARPAGPAKYPSLPAAGHDPDPLHRLERLGDAAKVELAHGIRLDTNYYYWPPAWVEHAPGFFTGSGMPMRFADSTAR